MKYKTGDQFKANQDVVNPDNVRLFTKGVVYTITVKIAVNGMRAYTTVADNGDIMVLSDELLDDFFEEVDDFGNFDYAMSIVN